VLLPTGAQPAIPSASTTTVISAADLCIINSSW